MTALYYSASGDDTTGDGSIGTPYKTLTRMVDTDYPAAIAGDTFNFNGGDSFEYPSGRPILANSVDASANPIIIQSYGTGQAILDRGNVADIFITVWNNVKGITFDNLEWNGRYLDNGIANGLFSCGNPVTDIVIQNCLFRNASGGLHIKTHLTNRIARVDILNNYFDSCKGMAILAGCDDLVIEGNTFNNCAGLQSTAYHTIYIGVAQLAAAPAQNITVRDNVIFNDNLWTSGDAVASAIAAHGHADNLIIDGNHIRTEDGHANGGHYHIDVTDGNPPAELDWITNVTITNNIMENPGNIGINVNKVDGLTIENNSIYKETDTNGNSRIEGIVIGDFNGMVTTDITVNNNTIYAVSGLSGGNPQTAVTINATGTVVSNANNNMILYTRPLNFQLMQLPTKGYLDGIGESGGSGTIGDGSFTYTDETTAPTTDSFTYKIRDTNGISSAATASLTIVSATQTLTLSGTTKGMSIPGAALAATGDKLYFTFNTTTNIDNHYLFDGNSGDRVYAFFSGSAVTYTDTLVSLKFDGTSVATGQSIAAYQDGADHILEASWVSGAATITHIGLRYTVAQSFNGDIKLLSQDISSTVHSWDIDSGSTTTDDSTPTGTTLIYHNIVSGDWT